MTTLKHLAEVEPAFTRTPTLHQVRQIVSHLRTGYSLDESLQQLDGLESEDVVHLVEGLGRYISQTTKVKVDAVVLPWDASGTMFFAPSQEELAAERKAKKANPKAGLTGKSTNFIPAEVSLDQEVVFLPHSWTKIELEKNLSQSVATVVLTDIDDDEVTRFLNRYYSRSEITVSAEHLFLLQWLSENKLLGRLEKLDEKHYALASVLTKTWESLLVWQGEAQESYAALCNTPEDTWEAQELLDHVDRCAWLWPAELEQVRSALQAVHRSAGNESVKMVAQRRLDSFSKVAGASGKGSIAIPEGLTFAHVHYLAKSQGLTGHEDEEKSVRSELRAWLIDNNLVNDIDIEVEAGVGAWRLGLLNEFYANREDRVQGDHNWSTAWQKVLTTA